MATGMCIEEIGINVKNYKADTIKFLKALLNIQTVALFLTFTVGSFMIIWNFFSRSEAILNISWVSGFVFTCVYCRNIKKRRA